MRDAYEILLRPSITEKSTRLKEGQNTLVFEVDPRANKTEIRRAVEQAFGVKVEEVRTLNRPGKVMVFGRRMGRRPDRKRALVRLKAGEKVDFIEGT